MVSIRRSFTSVSAIVALGLSGPTFAGIIDTCDVDFDADVDTYDISAIFDSRGLPASGTGDQRDYDHDGNITVNDARGCVLLGETSTIVNPTNPTIGFDPFMPMMVSAGDHLTIDVVVSGLGGGIVSAYDLDLTYDDSILQMNFVSFADALGDALLDANLLAPGVLDVAAVSLESDAELALLQGTSPVTLFTLGITAIASGETSLGFVFDTFNDVKGANNEMLPLKLATVPEPGTLVLLGIGLIGFAASRRRVRPER